MNKEELLHDSKKSLEILNKLANLKIGQNYPCPFHHGSKDSKNFNIFVDKNDNSLKGYCFGDCERAFDIFQLICGFGNKTEQELDIFLSENDIDIEELNTPNVNIKKLFISQEQNINKYSNYEFIKKTLEDRKISLKTLNENCLLLNNEQIKFVINDKINDFFPNVDTKLFDMTREEYIRNLFQSSTISVPLIDIHKNYLGFTFCYPLKEKSYRYKHKKNINLPVYLFEDKIKYKDSILFITEGLFTALTLRNKNLCAIATLGTGKDNDCSHLNAILNKYTQIRKIMLCFDVDDVGHKKTFKFLENFKRPNIEVKIFNIPNEYNKEKAIDDLLNNNNMTLNKLSECFINYQTFKVIFDNKYNNKKLEYAIIDNVKRLEYEIVYNELFNYLQHYQNNPMQQKELVSLVEQKSKYIYPKILDNIADELMEISIRIKNKRLVNQAEFDSFINEIKKLISDK